MVNVGDSVVPVRAIGKDPRLVATVLEVSGDKLAVQTQSGTVLVSPASRYTVVCQSHGREMPCSYPDHA